MEPRKFSRLNVNQKGQCFFTLVGLLGNHIPLGQRFIERLEILDYVGGEKV